MIKWPLQGQIANKLQKMRAKIYYLYYVLGSMHYSWISLNLLIIGIIVSLFYVFSKATNPLKMIVVLFMISRTGDAHLR